MSRDPAARHPEPAAEPAAPSERALTDPWSLGGVPIANRVVLAPLAGIGNWFVRLQAKRHGAGLVISEMVSSFAVHYRNERTCTELLRIHPDEHPVSIQLFGHDPEVMASAAERVAAAGADLIDINMGCPVPKVCKTGAGAALLADPDRRWRIAQAAARGSGPAGDGQAALRAAPRATAAGSSWPRLAEAAPWPASACIPATPPSVTPASRLRARARADRAAAGSGAHLRRAAHPGAGAARRLSAPAPRRSRSPAARWATRGCSQQLLGDRDAEPDPRGDPRPSSTG